jgi:hypothetical protein
MKLTKEQYSKLIEKRSDFEIASQGYLRNIDQGWIGDLGRIYQDIFNTPFNARCGACVIESMNKMFPLILEYEKPKEKIELHEPGKHGRQKKNPE